MATVAAAATAGKLEQAGQMSRLLEFPGLAAVAVAQATARESRPTKRESALTIGGRHKVEWHRLAAKVLLALHF